MCRAEGSYLYEIFVWLEDAGCNPLSCEACKQKGHHHCHPFLPPKGNGRTVNINRLLKQRPSNNQALGSVCSAKLNEKQQALWKR